MRMIHLTGTHLLTMISSVYLDTGKCGTCWKRDEHDITIIWWRSFKERTWRSWWRIERLPRNGSRKIVCESVGWTTLGQGPMGASVNSRTQTLGKNFLTRRKSYQLIKEDPAPCGYKDNITCLCWALIHSADAKFKTACDEQDNEQCNIATNAFENS
jgi:hypothetical protein